MLDHFTNDKILFVIVIWSSFLNYRYENWLTPADDLARCPEGRVLQQAGGLRRRERLHQHPDDPRPLLRRQPHCSSSNEVHHQQVH